MATRVMVSAKSARTAEKKRRMFLIREGVEVCFLLSCLVSPTLVKPQAAAAEPWQSTYLVGVNLPSAAFGESRKGQHGTSYVYPVESFAPGYKSPSYFVSKGMNTFRLAFLWERIQPKLGETLDPKETERLVTATEELLRLGAWVILDLHNYARYDNILIGSTAVKIDDFADVWRRLAALFKDKDRVVVGLMNEPHDMRTETWIEAANAGIAAVREAGSKHLILVPGNHWSSAKAWYDDFYGTPNAKALLGIVDPLSKVVFEAHTYLDADASGTDGSCVSDTIGLERLQPFTRWLRENGKLGFVGEFGAGGSKVCINALSAMLRSIWDNPDIYLGWTYWSAGPMWRHDYFTLIEPHSGDAPQMSALMPYVLRRSPAIGR
jgi:endoglucanase